MAFKVIIAFLLNQAQAFDVVKLDEVSIDYKRFAPYSRNQLITDNGLASRQMADGVGIVANARLFEYMYWDNTILGMTDKTYVGSGQYRSVGWEFRLGFQMAKVLQVGFYHHSQHVLDHDATFRYPLEDAFELKLILFKEGAKDGLFDSLVTHSR